MSLVCNMTLSQPSVTAGQSSQATLTVFNPNASAVVVTGMQVQVSTSGQYTPAVNQSLPPMGWGMTTTVPATSSITFGPFPIASGSAANVNSFAAVNQTGNINPVNPQPSQRPQQVLMVGATVYGSDGSVNTSGTAPLLVSYVPAPPLNFQGGPLLFAAPNNLALGLTTGIL